MRSALPLRAVVLLILLTLIGAGCDRLQAIELVNELDETVTITFRFDRDKYTTRGPELRPGARGEETFVVDGNGIQVRAVTESGRVVLDRYYRWEELETAYPYVIVIRK